MKSSHLVPTFYICFDQESGVAHEFIECLCCKDWVPESLFCFLWCESHTKESKGVPDVEGCMVKSEDEGWKDGRMKGKIKG